MAFGVGVKGFKEEFMKSIPIVILSAAVLCGCVSQSTYDSIYAPKVDRIDGGLIMIEAAQLAIGGIYTAASANQYNRLSEGNYKALEAALKSTADSPVKIETIVTSNSRFLLVLRRVPTEWQPASNHDVLWLYFIADRSIGRGDVDPFHSYRRGQCYASEIELALYGLKIQGGYSFSDVLMAAVLGEPIRPTTSSGHEDKPGHSH